MPLPYSIAAGTTALGVAGRIIAARAAGYIRYPDGNKLAFISQETSGN
jgi:hypothetical protein